MSSRDKLDIAYPLGVFDEQHLKNTILPGIQCTQPISDALTSKQIQ